MFLLGLKIGSGYLMLTPLQQLGPSCLVPDLQKLPQRDLTQTRATDARFGRTVEGIRLTGRINQSYD
jgi:hypothetical protein